MALTSCVLKVLPTFVLKAASSVPSELSRLTNPETDTVPPTTIIFPSDCTPTPVTSSVTDADAFVLNAESAMPFALKRRRNPVNAPPTRIFPSLWTAVARAVDPRDVPIFVV